MLGGLVLGMVSGCGEGQPDQPAASSKEVAPAKEAPAEEKTVRPEGPLPALLVVQAQFIKKGGRPVPGPAKLVIVRTDGKEWYEQVIEDEESNVFHKAVAWRDGILTIGAMGAKLRHWTEVEGTWTPATLWEKSWGGKFDRLRDIELADLNGDGEDELIIATHDQGVIAVGTEDESWTFTEMDQKPDTFVHEIEVGDVDGDGKMEFYSTPSDRNRASGVSQPGGVARYDWTGSAYERSTVVHWDASHAKEILVADVTQDGTDELYVVREAHTEKKDGKTVIVDPVQIIRLDPSASGKWSETVVAELQDKQCRFLVPGDVDHDGKMDLVAAGMDSGLWMLTLQDDGSFEKTLIDKNSGGFEHSTHVADLDGDGKSEIYVAADKQKALRRYVWNGSSFGRKKLAAIPEQHITWNIQDAKL
jgi:hypothetical protein